MRDGTLYSSSTTLAKKIETGTPAKHRRVHARQIMGLCHVRAVVSIFFGQGSRMESSRTKAGSAATEGGAGQIYRAVDLRRPAVID